MKTIHKKLLLSLLMAIIGILSYTSVIDNLFQKVFTQLDGRGSQYFNETIKRSIYTFAIVRGINGVVSVIQGTTVAVSPAGVGVQLAMGEMLDPVNDLVERFSWVMLVSATSLGIQKILMEMGTWLGFKILLSFSMAMILAGIWVSQFLKFDLIASGCKLVLVSLIIRFCIPAVAIISEKAYHLFLEKEYTESVRSLEEVSREIKDTSIVEEGLENRAADDPGYMGALKKMYKSTKDVIGIKDRILFLKDKISDYAKYTTSLIIVFILQTIIIPVSVLWLLIRFISYLWGSDIFSRSKTFHSACEATGIPFDKAL